MCQKQYSTNKRNFKQLTYKERIKTETLYNDKHLNYTQIGEILGKHRTTISREIKLGLVELEKSYLIETQIKKEKQCMIYQKKQKQEKKQDIGRWIQYKD